MPSVYSLLANFSRLIKRKREREGEKEKESGKDKDIKEGIERILR